MILFMAILHYNRKYIFDTIIHTSHSKMALDWNFRQVFGDVTPVDQVQDADLISSLRFSQDGAFLAAGDRGGRVIIFQRHTTEVNGKAALEYQFYAEFQAHVQGFDALRSV